MLRFLTAGESHGKALMVVVEGLPAGLPFTTEMVTGELARRRLGYGRGPRMRFEADEVTLLGGVRHGRTLGSPVGDRDRQHRVAQVDRGDVAGPGATGQGPDPAPTGPCRPGRDAEVRLRRRPGRAGAGLGPRDRRPGRRRVDGQGAARAPGGAGGEPRDPARGRAGARRGAAPPRATSGRSTHRPCAASTPPPRRRWWRRSSRRPRRGTPSGGWPRCSPTGCRWVSAATCTGTASSTPCWPGP